MSLAETSLLEFLIRCATLDKLDKPVLSALLREELDELLVLVDLELRHGRRVHLEPPDPDLSAAR